MKQMSAFELAPEPYRCDWPEFFRHEALKIKELSKNLILNIEHIGSTSVAGVRAKPIIDIIIEVEKGRLTELILPLTELKYNSKGENGIAGRSYFSRASTDICPAFHIHAFEKNHFEVTKHLAFRDYLRAHQEVKKSYSDLKEKIMAIHGMTRSKYQELKNDFVNEQTQKAIQWFLQKTPIKRVKKAVIYVAREKNGEMQILVFDHVKHPEVNPQVPSGTIEESEDILTGAIRELFEESGLDLGNELKFLGFYEYYKNHANQLQERNHFLVFGNNLSDQWKHTVTGTGNDQNSEFKYYWLPLTEARQRLQVGLGDGLEYFEKKIQNCRILL